MGASVSERLVVCVATTRPDEITSFGSVCTFIRDNSVTMRGVVESYQYLYENTDAPVLAYFHDDIELYDEKWIERVLVEFGDPEVGVVGFGGAKAHGLAELYTAPYKLTNLARIGYLSNMRDAEDHGQRFHCSCDVAVLDGFALIVRRELLDKCGGWHPEDWPPHHIYDYVLAAQAHRHGYKIRLVGVSCQHFGGRTATTTKYLDWCKTTKWGSDQKMHEEGHRLFYERFRDVMPWRCL